MLRGIRRTCVRACEQAVAVPYVRLVSELRHGSEKLVAAAATQSGFYFCFVLGRHAN
jgi:hypothetical protein